MSEKTKDEKVKEQIEIGKIGEDFFLKYYVPTIKQFVGKQIVDMRGTQFEKDYDIDFLILPKEMFVDKDNLEWQKSIKNELIYHTEEKIGESKIFAIEVKTDTKAIKTGNIAYDITSHNKPGGLARSLADFAFFVIIDKNNMVAKYCMVNMFKFRRIIGEQIKDVNKVKGFFMTYFKDEENEKDGNSLLLLTSFNFLEKNNVAKVYNFKVFNGTL